MSKEPLDLPADIALATRRRIPEELVFMLQDFPRDIWRDHENMGELTKFWLSRHRQFRMVSSQLNVRNTEFLNGEISPTEFAQSLVPGFNMLLGALTQHHTIEDEHYFPKFVAAAPELIRGFEILDSDHNALHDAMDLVVETANGFSQSESKDDLLKNGERFVHANEKLLAFIKRHLEDEEDLIVPILLDNGEARFS